MAHTQDDAPEPKATFVFKGTVKKLKAATMRSVPVDNHTIVVRVEQVVEAPSNLAHYAGKEITVRLAGRAKVAVGQQLMFHTAGWIFGDGIAVRAVSQEAVTGAHAALLARGGDPAEHKSNRELQERVDEADLVVSGKVIAVNLPGGSESATKATRGSVPVSGKPVSEHDPKWREAVIAVDDVHKGHHTGDKVTVLFPASTDVRWFKAPKFEAGQQGYFVLHKGKMKPSERLDARGLAKEADAEEGETEVYTALNPLDFQPFTQQQRVRSAIGGATREASGKEN